MDNLPSIFNVPVMLSVAVGIFLFFVYLLAVKIMAKAGKADQDVAFRQSLVGGIGLAWFGIATAGVVGLVVIGTALYQIVFKV